MGVQVTDTRRPKGRPKGSKNDAGAGKTGPRFTKAERESKRAQVMDLLLKDYPQHQIATIARVSEAQVSLWLRDLKQSWMHTQTGGRDELVNRKLRQFEQVRMEAWQEWERSKADIQRRVVTSGSKGNATWDKEELVTEGRVAAASFMNIILDTFKQERAMLGLDAEVKGGDTRISVGLNWQSVLMEARIQADPIGALEARINAPSLPEEEAVTPALDTGEVELSEEELARL